MEIIGYLILALMVIIIPMTVTILYTRMVYNHNKEAYKPWMVFSVLMVAEILYLLYLYFFKMK